MKPMLKAVLFTLLAAGAVQAQASPGFSRIGSALTATSFVDGTCPNQNTCYYQVVSVDASGHESAPAGCALLQLCYAGNQSVATMPSSGVHTVAVSWTAPTLSAGVTVTYNLYRTLGPPSPLNVTSTVN